ncbi:MAG: NUDIX hydrolase [Acholeplasmatales bacterium]|nr:NUDIX hydrolase [Acholeplasmatales bacterium]
MEEKKIDGKVIYDGKIIKVFKDRVLCPNGNESFREIVHHNGGAGVLLINDKEEILLVKQFRYAYKEELYEIPAGKLELNEDPYYAALRELEEETGNQANELEYLGKIYPTCGYSDEVIYLYLARNTKVTKTNFDEDEFIESNFYPLDVVKKMIKDGKIKDAKTICALEYYSLLKG